MTNALKETYIDFPNAKPTWLRFVCSLNRYNSVTVVLLFRYLSYLKSNKVSLGGGEALVFRILNKRYSKLCSILNVFLPISTEIGSGLLFPHGFPLVINPEAKLGKNCIIHPCVLIGRDRGKEGAPIIGDNVFIGHGSKIIGNPQIGNWTFISPAAVITKDIPDGSLVGAGVNNIINNKGKEHVLMYIPDSYKAF